MSNKGVNVGHIRISGIIDESIVDGDGIRAVIFAQGCAHNCHGCQNPETHDFNGGVLMTYNDILKKLPEPYEIDGITLSGGDPLYQAKDFLGLVKILKEKYGNIWLYTGFVWEDVMKGSNEDMKQLLLSVDIVVDGKYDESKRSITSTRPCGSENQRIIDVEMSKIFNEVSYK